MNFTITKSDLLQVINKVKGIPMKSSNMPVLAHVHLMTEGDNLILTATDLELMLRVKGKAQVFGDGHILLPADTLFRIIKNMPAGDISFEEAQNHKVNITGGSAKYNLFGLAGEEFPGFPNLAFDKRFSISSKTLSSMLEKTMFAGSKKDGPANLGGVFFEVCGENGNHTLCMVATDGHRLAKVEVPSTNGISKLDKGIIIPLKGCNELMRLSREGDSEIELGITERNLSACRQDESLVIRLLEGSFPNFRAVTKDIKGKVVSSEKRSFEESLERILVMAQGTYHQVSFSLKNRDRLVIDVKNQDLGEAQDSLPIQSELEKISVSFNPNYLLEGLRVMKSRDVDIMLNDGQSPALISGKEDEGFGYIVMPMRG